MTYVTVYSLLALVLIGLTYRSKSLSGDDCQAVQVELYRQTTYLIGELKMEMDELRGALAIAQTEAEALKAKNLDLATQLAEANKIPDDVAAQANQLVATLAS